MKLGLISDIHGDPLALKTSLNILRREGAAQILCAGDLVERGPKSDTIVTVLRQQAIPCVRGNHDEDAIDNQVWVRENTSPNSPMWIKNDNLAFLRNLPSTLSATIDNQRLLIAHGTPHSNHVYIRSSNIVPIFQMVLQQAQADVVVLGHTHAPMHINVDGKTILNPGSICGSYTSGSRTCAILSMPEGKFHVFSLETGQRIDIPIRRA